MTTQMEAPQSQSVFRTGLSAYAIVACAHTGIIPTVCPPKLGSTRPIFEFAGLPTDYERRVLNREVSGLNGADLIAATNTVLSLAAAEKREREGRR